MTLVPKAVPPIVLLGALVARTLAAVAGSGGAVILLPVPVWTYGVRDGVPILTVVQLVGDLSRVVFSRRELVLRVVGWFAVGAVPAAAMGGALFPAAPASSLRRLRGVFLLAAVAVRHSRAGWRASVDLRGFAGVGGALGPLSALVGTVGPLAAPFFLSYGLVKGAYIGTEALTAVVMHLVRLVVREVRAAECAIARDGRGHRSRDGAGLVGRWGDRRPPAGAGLPAARRGGAGGQRATAAPCLV